MVTSTGLTKSALSIALTGCSVAYGAGQLISGYFGDKIQPKRLISIGLLTSVLMNLSIPLCTNPAQMLVVWCINGFAQAFMWPPLVKFMSTMFSPEDYSRGCVRVSWGSSIGTIVIYLIAPLFIALWGWKSVFVICAAMGILGLLLWRRSCPFIEMSVVIRQGEISSTGGRALLPVVVLTMIAIVLQGILRDGVATWMPSYIAETYSLSNEISILTGVVMPVFGMACHQFSVYLYNKKIKNPLLCSAALFGIGAASAVFLNLLQGGNVAISVLLSSVLTGCMHGVNMILICIVPPLVAKPGRVSVVSGLFNSCTYIGSAISTYGMALVTERSGWSVTILLWLLVALAGTLLCSACVPAWKRLGHKIVQKTLK